MKTFNSGLNRHFSYNLLTGRPSFYPFGLILKETYSCGETDLNKHPGSPDFVTRSWICTRLLFYVYAEVVVPN